MTETQDLFIKEVSVLHPELEVLTEFVNKSTKVKVRTKYGVCYTTPAILLRGNRPTIQSALDKTEYFINQARDKHGSKYDYSKTKYVRGKDKIVIICPEHGEFIQKAEAHLEGRGCKSCANEITGGWTKSHYIEASKGREALVYVIECWNDTERFYKIGRTYNNVAVRFHSGMPYEYKVLKEFKGSAGYAYDEELRLQRMNKSNKYMPLIQFNGRHECFSSIELPN